MDFVSGTPDAHGKYVIAGSTDEECEGSWMNTKSIEQLVPAPRIRAWIRAFRDVNKHVIANMYVQASRRVERIAADGGDIGANGRHFLDTPWHQWFLQAAEIHAFADPGLMEEDLQFDGVGSLVHMGFDVVQPPPGRLPPRGRPRARVLAADAWVCVRWRNVGPSTPGLSREAFGARRANGRVLRGGDVPLRRLSA